MSSFQQMWTRSMPMSLMSKPTILTRIRSTAPLTVKQPMRRPWTPMKTTTSTKTKM
jgi:hypothetical protein